MSEGREEVSWSVFLVFQGFRREVAYKPGEKMNPTIKKIKEVEK